MDMFLSLKMLLWHMMVGPSSEAVDHGTKLRFFVEDT